jgi:hypothetical protein
MVADGDFVLEDEFQELEVAQASGLGLLEADIEGGRKPGEPELAEGGAEVVMHGRGLREKEGTENPDPSR